jgi:hypothetical protein
MEKITNIVTERASKKRGNFVSIGMTTHSN